MKNNCRRRISWSRKGFTLIEVLVVMGILAVLATVVLVAINPARHFAESRDLQRQSNINAILNTVGQRMVDNGGIFETGCLSGVLPATSTVIKSSGGYDLYPCIVPTYIALMPFDPKTGHFTNATDYDSGYTILHDAAGRVTITAPGTELAPAILTVTR